MNVKCNNCGAMVSDTAKFCQECGSKIEKKQICSNCGAELLEGAKFCVECGMKVTMQESTNDMESLAIDKIPNDIDLSKAIVNVSYVLENISDTLEEIDLKVMAYNDKAMKHGYSLLTLNYETNTLTGCFFSQKIRG